MSKSSVSLLSVALIAAGSLHAADLTEKYSWKPMKIGGGGWVVGMDVSPTEKDLIYVRTDVSGAYRWDAATSKWTQIVTAASLPAEYAKYGSYRGVDSLVSAPGDPTVAYMAYERQIFRSANRGETWASTSFDLHQVRMEPNGDGRQEGERLAVDPRNSDVVYYGSIADGLWVTTDAGATWREVAEIPVGTAPRGVNTIVFDKASGTMAADKGKLRTKSLFVTVDKKGVFQSKDGGASWAEISKSGPGDSGSMRDAEIGADGTYYVAYAELNGASAVWKRSAAGVWKDITPPGEYDEGQTYCEIAVDPGNPRKIVVLRNGGRGFVSNDQGESWTSQGFRLNSPNIKWLGEQENHWLSVGEIAFDPFSPGKLWFAEGFGVWWTSDLAREEIVWQAESAGIEETCGNDIVCPPGGKPVGAMWDVGVFRFDDPDEYTARRGLPYFMSAWALDWCAADPKFLVAVFRNHLSLPPHINETGYSTDGGITWRIFPGVRGKRISQDLEYGVIAVSANSPDKIVWAPAKKKLPYYTADRGLMWKPSSLGEGVTDTGFDGLYSPQKSLCADRVLPDTFYFYHAERGVFRSTDGGATFTKTAGTPPVARPNSVMKAVPGQAGHLLFAEGHQGNPVGGLWHSSDGGVTWSQLPFIEQAFNFGLGKPKEGGGPLTIFVAGVAKGETGIFRSSDAGVTWDKISSHPLGLFDWIDAMDGDKETFGKVYLAFTSAGFAYGEEIAAP